MSGFSKTIKRQHENEPDRSTLVPRIKHANFLTALQEMSIPADQMPLTEPFIGDLLIAYAFDMPGVFQMASRASVERLSLKPGELRELGIHNLRKQLNNVEFEGELPLLALKTGNDLEACTLLIPEIWHNLATQVPGQVVVGVPSRNLVLVTGSASKVGLESIVNLVEEAYRQDQVHCLTRGLLTWCSGKWELYQPNW